MQEISLSRSQKIAMILLLDEKERRWKKYRFKRIFDILYSWQKNEFIGATKNYSAVCLCAANRIGKTFTGTYIDAAHLTGDYHDDWPGYKFTKAPTVWCLGYSGEKTRDLLQSEIFGRLSDGKFEGGLILPELIVDYKSMSGTPGAMREVRVKHKSGGISTCQFWSYSQGQHALMGDSIDWYHIDEEPKDDKIYPQVLVRTATGGNVINGIAEGGRGVLTFTPENGRTEIVIKFMDNPSASQIFIQKGWDDAPHLSEDVKNKLIESFPAHQRDMRTKGVPMLGHGRIYDMSEDDLLIDPFPLPNHFKVIGGMDFGYDHPQSQVKLAYDADMDIVYLTNSWKKSKCSANDAYVATKHWQKNVPVSWPHDGLMHEKGRDNAKQQKDLYVEAGFKLLYDRATWDGKSNSVEQGIYEIRQRMLNGTFKIFKGNPEFIQEFLQYHRDEKGKIVKARDDILDAVRYAYMMIRFAESVRGFTKQTYVTANNDYDPFN